MQGGELVWTACGGRVRVDLTGAGGFRPAAATELHEKTPDPFSSSRVGGSVCSEKDSRPPFRQGRIHGRRECKVVALFDIFVLWLLSQGI
jgi:hypothetical protein